MLQFFFASRLKVQPQRTSQGENMMNLKFKQLEKKNMVSNIKGP
jgi:hypothetical protein